MRLSLRPTAARRGFTLVELMIVVGIVILLVVMATAAVMKFRDTGPHIATQMNLSKIKAALDTQWKAVRDQAQKEPIDSTLAGLLVPGATSGANLEVRKRYVEARLKASFPVSFAEAMNPNSPTLMAASPTLKAYSGYTGYLNNVFTPNSAAADSPDKQQAICLLMILQRGPMNTGITPDQLGTSGALRLTLKVNGVEKEDFGCVDAWGRPVRFTRDGNGANSFVPAILSTGANGKFDNTWRPNPDTSDDISTLGL